MAAELSFEIGILVGFTITLLIVFGIIDTICISPKRGIKDDDNVQMDWGKVHIQNKKGENL